MHAKHCVLGVDGGGSKTIAWLTSKYEATKPFGIGASGPSNMLTVGKDIARHNLDEAVDQAFASAQIEVGPVAATVLGLAGSDRDFVRKVFLEWAEQRSLSLSIQIVHDAETVLAAGSPTNWGVALIAGTGSFCFARSQKKLNSRAGGWGPLLGDEGSGYSIAVDGLRAAAKAADQRDSDTALLTAFMDKLNVTSPIDMIPAVHASFSNRPEFASLAKIVFMAAAEKNDEAAIGIIDKAAQELALMAHAAVRTTKMEREPFPLCMTGGVLISQADFRDLIVRHMQNSLLKPEPVTIVEQPVVGAVRLARRLA